MNPGTIKPTPAVRLAVTLLLGAYGFVMIRNPETYRLIDNVDLAIHETGHIVFMPFGEVAQFLGGTLFQLIVPMVFLGYFIKNGDRHAGTIMVWWIAQNCWNVARYVQDARTQELPLVGGGVHDWGYLLAHWRLLPKDQEIARAIFATGVILFFFAVVMGAVTALQSAPADEAQTA